MAENKRYYFLQMPENFFYSKRIKKLRSLAGGDTFTIIYLKMQLKAMNNKGVLVFDGLDTDIAEEIALDIDEKAENVRITIDYLQRCGLLEIRDNGDCYLPYAEINVGSVTASTIRSQKSRANKSVAMQQTCNAIATNCNGDIDIEIDTDIEIDKETDKGAKAPKRFQKPSLEDIQAYISEKGYSVNPEAFYNYYESNGWKVGRNPMKDWKAAIRTWQSKEKPAQKEPKRDKFHNFDERDYDYDALEKKLLGRPNVTK